MSKLESLARYPLATLPTPLDELPCLSRELGIRVLMKRDDLTGFALGGNKARKLEFLVADALAQGTDMLVTGGGPQSNHARMTAAAARKVGMDCQIVFFGTPPSQVNGNLLLDELLGAQMMYANTEDKSETDRVLVRVTDELRAQGRKPYLIPVGGSTPLGCASYMLATSELLEQLRAIQVAPDYIFITTGSCGTHAGILAGMKYYNATIPVYGITVSRVKSECLQRIPALIEKTAQLLNHQLPTTHHDLLVNDNYIGPGYALGTTEGRDAILKTARLEGIFLDPVYTGKTMAGLIDLVRRGDIVRGATVIFWHTGGAPGIFGYPKDVLP
ncbi:L-cysteate sulfo-lyase [Anaerolineae bacterium]|nr:L-cysteate sulfo-lyase [Anaerolineae bacterium]